MSSMIQNDDAAKIIVRLPTVATDAATQDDGRVRLGGLSPAFRLASIADAGRVRVGGLGPVFRIADAGKVRLGGLSPAFG